MHLANDGYEVLDEFLWHAVFPHLVDRFLKAHRPLAFLGLPFTLLEYQPLYRSMAGTGSGMGFGYWM
jgi:hypothetical protein